jgi:hypothetical protein
LKPTVYSTETVAAGNGTSNATVLSPTTTVSLVTTATNSSHVTLGKGIEGQLKVIIHKTRSNSVNLVITPEDGIGGSSLLAAGSTLTSNLGSRAIQLLFDGSQWQIVAGEISDEAEMVIA